MKKVELKQTTPICGAPTIKAGTQFKVVKFNKRYIYVNYPNEYCLLRLPRSAFKVIY